MSNKPVHSNQGCFFAGRNQSVAATLVFDKSRTVEGNLLDLSTRGARLELTERVRGGDADLQLAAAEVDTINLSAKIVSCDLADLSGNYTVSCRFHTELSQDRLLKLAEANVLTQRSHDRHPVTIPVQLRWELHANDSAVLVDLSDSGFSLVTAHKGSIGQRLQAFVKEPELQVALTGEIRWQSKMKDGKYRLGCESFTANMESECQRLCDFFASVITMPAKKIEKASIFSRLLGAFSTS